MKVNHISSYAVSENIGDLESIDEVFLLVHSDNKILLKECDNLNSSFVRINAQELKKICTDPFNLEHLGKVTSIKTGATALISCNAENIDLNKIYLVNKTSEILKAQEQRRFFNTQGIFEDVDLGLFLTEWMAVRLPETDRIFTPSNNQFWERVWEGSKDSKSSYSKREQRQNAASHKIAFWQSCDIHFESAEQILESGCGNANVVIELSKRFGIKAFGIDFSEVSIQDATKLAEESNIDGEFLVSDIRKTAFSDEIFDKTISLGVIEHLQNPLLSLSEMHRNLKPNGQLILMTPNKNSFCSVDRHYRQLRGTWPMGYQTEYKPKELANLSSLVGLEPIFETASTRPINSHDQINMRAVAVSDNVVNRVNPKWGFYSWAISNKPSR